ncbi:hypothetical protein FJV41_44520 [Myxococcus llanfairpwllgwyngyllgogerychwyrndrobwllllantysiliogogogochensis]|uniref:Lipoprotein n=1 Tax=Myxococcus llanfairpwllgwyngyllgogerychwyrndrobwllllantysiliogogogochensis TaxID=2590453 RepID=A0A540WKA1_9BACT|nr:hypothetical protein [Myxococcus llanfairpwllgwyngyllgogerychwyrndrobwllllantysiliogogogochensis]TQF09450.1 hypothetical protein FJV41_44520 [Myxococcus llanfairpwllgwyngyllgogerychwyrndrobwllllantysiliogogogochensis]
MLARRPLPSLSLLVLAAFAVGCGNYTRMAPEARTSLQRTLTGPDAEQYLRVSGNVIPFFGDGSKRLLTPYAPDDVRFLDDSNGKPINPGAVERTLPVGTKLRITKVEFPTAWVVAERVLYTPRTWPWVYLAEEGKPDAPPLVLVLPPNLEQPNDFRAEVEKYLSAQNPKSQLEALAPPVRDAVREKRLVANMSADAVRMAWGPPELVRRTLEGTAKNEEWTYPGGRRKAFITDGRLARAEEAGASVLP